MKTGDLVKPNVKLVDNVVIWDENFFGIICYTKLCMILAEKRLTNSNYFEDCFYVIDSMTGCLGWVKKKYLVKV